MASRSARAIVAALGVAVIGAAAASIWMWVGREPRTRFPEGMLAEAQTPVDWRDVVAQVKAAASVKNTKRLGELAGLIASRTPSDDQLNDFVMAAVLCARSREDLRAGDPHQLLQRAVSILGEKTSAYDTRVGLADAFARLGLLRRAKEVLAPVPAGYAQGRALSEKLDEGLARFGGDRGMPKQAERDPLRLRLLDLITVPALNEHYDLLSGPTDFEQSDTYAEDGPPTDWKTSPAVDRESRLRASPLAPLFQSARRGDASGGPPAPSEAARTWEDHELIGRPQDLSRAPGWVDAVDAVLAEWDGGKIAAIEAIRSTAASERLISLAQGLGGDESDRLQIVQIIIEPTHTLVVLASRLRTMMLINVESSVRALWALPNLTSMPGLQVIDATGDHRPELWFTKAEGSGNFFSGTLYSLEGRLLWTSGEPASRGAIAFINLDLDPELEIVFRVIHQWNIANCIQCPATYHARIFDFRTGIDRFEEISSSTTHAEMLTDTSIMFTGLSVRMLAGRHQGALADNLKTLADQAAPDEQRSEAGLGIDMMYRALIDNGGCEQAAQVAMAVADALANEAERSTDARAGRVGAYEQAQVAYISCGMPDRARQLVDQAWYVENRPRVGAHGQGQLALHNARAVVALNEARYAVAFDDLWAARALTSTPNPRVEGNLALYYRAVRNFPAAAESAYRALDGDVAAGDGTFFALNLVHAAAAAAELGDDRLALDYLLRAFRLARAAPSSSGTEEILAFEVAASIALRHDWPELAQALLDEGLVKLSPLIWRTSAGSILFLYGESLRRMGQLDFAAEVLEAAGQRAAEVSQQDVTSARLALSRVALARGDAPKAIQEAQRAFEAIGAGRVAIREEDHKLSFLTDKKAVVAWLGGLLMRQHQGEELLRVLEGWKLRTFLETFDLPSANAAAPQPSARMSDSLLRLLDGQDLFIDFFIGDDTSFAITVGRAIGLRVIPLNITSRDAEQLVERIRLGMDIRNPTSLAQIRSDTITPQLRDDLRRAYRELLQPAVNGTGARRLLLSPDEALFGLPWAALETDGRAVVDVFDIASVPSADFYLRQTSRRTTPTAKGNRALIVGAFGAVSAEELSAVSREPMAGHLRSGLTALRNGSGEVERVGAALEGASLEGIRIEYLVDGLASAALEQRRAGDATKDNVLRRMPGAAIVHVVSHGLFVPGTPMQSALFLSGPPGQRALLASELLRIRLDEVDLVSLAACQTAMTSRVVGSEPFGFLRALFGAGVRRVILMEWEVDDFWTAELFPSVYKRVGQETRAAALRSAQLEMRRQHPHPYYWAAFSLHGAF